MVTRTKNQNTLVLGHTWNVLCDRCGFKFKSDDVLEEWTSYQVCADCYELRNELDFFRGFPDFQNVEYTRPDDGGQQSNGSNTDVDGNTFPNPDAHNTKSIGT